MEQLRKPSEVFGVRLKALRERRGFAQAELARRAREEGVQLDKAAVLRIEASSGRKLTLNEAVSLAWILQAVPAQLLTPPDGDYLALTARVGVDGDGLRNWFAYGDPLLARPEKLDTDEARDVHRARLEKDLAIHARALADAAIIEDKAGITTAAEGIIKTVRAHDEALAATEAKSDGR